MKNVKVDRTNLLNRIILFIKLLTEFLAEARKEFTPFHQEYMRAEKAFKGYLADLASKSLKGAKFKKDTSHCYRYRNDTGCDVVVEIFTPMSPTEHTRFQELLLAQREASEKLDEFLRSKSNALGALLKSDVGYYTIHSKWLTSEKTLDVKQFQKMIGIQTPLLILTAWKAFIESSVDSAITVGHLIDSSSSEYINTQDGHSTLNAIEKMQRRLLTTILE